MDGAPLPSPAAGACSQVRVLMAQFSWHIIFVENYSYICFYVGASLIIQANILKLWIKQNACQIKACSKNKKSKGQICSPEHRPGEGGRDRETWASPGRGDQVDQPPAGPSPPGPGKALRWHLWFFSFTRCLVDWATLNQYEECTSLAAQQLNPMSALRVGVGLIFPLQHWGSALYWILTCWKKYCVSPKHSVCGATSKGWRNNEITSLSESACLPETLLQITQRLLSRWLQS